jgi:calcineurin-like phosphoesterase family protein
MARTWFTSDTHFGHRGILKESMHCRRCDHFSSVEEMDAHMVAMWNSVVGPKDTVYHLGDFAYNTPQAHADGIFAKLRGRKVLIHGNHEQRGKRLAWAEQHKYLEVTVDGIDLVLFHYSMRSWNRMHHGSVHLFGHSHGSLDPLGMSLDVGVDCWGFRPVSVQEIMRRLTGEEDDEVLQACA